MTVQLFDAAAEAHSVKNRHINLQCTSKYARHRFRAGAGAGAKHQCVLQQQRDTDALALRCRWVFIKVAQISWDPVGVQAKGHRASLHDIQQRCIEVMTIEIYKQYHMHRGIEVIGSCSMVRMPFVGLHACAGKVHTPAT
eukprot:1142706-Pelagomonas_calceolata.AAC.3